MKKSSQHCFKKKMHDSSRYGIRNFSNENSGLTKKILIMHYYAPIPNRKNNTSLFPFDKSGCFRSNEPDALKINGLKWPLHQIINRLSIFLAPETACNIHRSDPASLSHLCSSLQKRSVYTRYSHFILYLFEFYHIKACKK